MEISLHHKLEYIYWTKEASIINLKYEDFKNLYNSLDKSLRTKAKTKRKRFKIGYWNYQKQGDWGKIYIHEGVANYKIYVCNLIDDEKNTLKEINEHMENKGRKSLKKVKDSFYEKNNVQFHKAFGCVNEEFLKCVPSQFYYQGNYRGVIDYISIVDYSSHYPSCMCGKLPNSQTSIRFNGTIKPNEEYPFAFYLKSGHIAEYNVFDTHNWLDSDYVFDLFKKNKDEFKNKHLSIKPDEDITILMKASDYTLTDIYQENYKLRNISEDAKLVMNSSIGQMHTKVYKSDKYAHLAAICIGRANQKILDVANKIGKYFIIQICVDGIIYKGVKQYGSDVKELGVLHQENIANSMFYKEYNRYIISELKHYENVISYKHSSCNYTNEGVKLDENYLPKDIYDIENWVMKTKEEELYEEED